MKHPGLQHQMRLHEIADRLVDVKGQYMHWERQRDDWRRKVDECQARMNELGPVLEDVKRAFHHLGNSTVFNENGLPVGYTAEQWKELTGKVLD